MGSLLAISIFAEIAATHGVPSSICCVTVRQFMVASNTSISITAVDLTFWNPLVGRKESLCMSVFCSAN